MPPLVVHTEAAHIDDKSDDYAPEVQEILRDGAALPATFR
jgi:hypothetical protein